ncbi:hypothetical protein ACG2F4_05145 [Halalkalibaculum sp. DA3122]|uniref:hypothetical protein n=1 Tax=Halalkalibaculum sp. DA3122 TaxID=3373607 RepID=UPI0037541FB3
MFNQLVEALHQALEFRDIPTDSISRIDGKVGFIWLKAGEQTYFIDIKKVDFDLDEYAQSHSRLAERH